MPLKLLVDTCVWLDLAKDYRHQPVISALEDLISAGEIELLIPQIVLDEFARNKDRVAADAARSLKSHFSLVRDAVTRFGEAAAKDGTLKALDDVDHAAIIRGEAVNASIGRVEKLLTSVPPMPTTDAVKARVTARAIANRAPYHRSKNSAGDAVLVELYADQVAADRPTGTRLAFVTHNARDFSEPTGDQRQPHPDLLPLFDGTHSVYAIDLVGHAERQAVGAPLGHGGRVGHARHMTDSRSPPKLCRPEWTLEALHHRVSCGVTAPLFFA